MKKLTSIGLSSDLIQKDFNNDSGQLRDFLVNHALDGIETILYGDVSKSNIAHELIEGVHLWYWPTWLDFWQGNQQAMLTDFLTLHEAQQYYELNSPTEIIGKYQSEWRQAKQLNASYMVFHVGHVSFKELLLCDYTHSSRDVLSAALDVINAAFTGDGPMLLFENLWYSGLTLREPDLVRWFFSEIHYKNKGFVLDISHLINTNPLIDTADNAVDFIHSVLDNLGDLTSHIHAIHLNQSLSGAYLRQNHTPTYKRMLSQSTLLDRFGVMCPHVETIDPHRPFTNPRINEIIDRIRPHWLVYEFITHSATLLSQQITLQNRSLIR
jgi:hypothetical protein